MIHVLEAEECFFADMQWDASDRPIFRRLHHDGIQFHHGKHLPQLIDQLQFWTVTVITHFCEHFRKGCRCSADIAGVEASLFLKKGREIPEFHHFDQERERALILRWQKRDGSFYELEMILICDFVDGSEHSVPDAFFYSYVGPVSFRTGITNIDFDICSETDTDASGMEYGKSVRRKNRWAYASNYYRWKCILRD